MINHNQQFNAVTANPAHGVSHAIPWVGFDRAETKA